MLDYFNFIFRTKQKKRKVAINYNKIKNNSSITILGHNYIVEHSGLLRGATYIRDDKIVVSGLEEHIARKIKEFITKLLFEEINYLANYYAKKLKVKYNKISIRQTRTRWGSCSSKGNLSFNMYLAFFPYTILEYVVVHELCHLVEMNHSPKFWKMVEFLYQNHMMAKSYLKKNAKKALVHKFEK